MAERNSGSAKLRRTTTTASALAKVPSRIRTLNGVMRRRRCSTSKKSFEPSSKSVAELLQGWKEIEPPCGGVIWRKKILAHIS